MADFARSDHARVQSQLDRLARSSPAGDRLGLERISRLLDRLSRPQDRLPPVFHVAGTNGKGSTCAFLRACLESAGLAVHAFTSPHLVRFNERIRIAGSLIADDQLADLLREVVDAGMEIQPSFFEVTTAAAFLAFAETAADACVIEVGLGGRLDATNVIDRPLVCGIASIGTDHQQFLGGSLAEIASEKAGIAKSGVPLLSVSQPPPAQAAIERVAKSRAAALLLEGRDWDIGSMPPLALQGAHQVRNAALAREMLRRQRRLPVDDLAIAAGLGSAVWPARFQRLGPGPLTGTVATWVDGAHNPEAARALAELVRDRGGMHVVLGILANKDAEAIVEAIVPAALSLTFVEVPGHDHHDPAGLAGRFGGRAAASLAEALDGLPGPRLIAGSLYLAGAALAANGEAPS